MSLRTWWRGAPALLLPLLVSFGLAFGTTAPQVHPEDPGASALADLGWSMPAGVGGTDSRRAGQGVPRTPALVDAGPGLTSSSVTAESAALDQRADHSARSWACGSRANTVPVEPPTPRSRGRAPPSSSV